MTFEGVRGARVLLVEDESLIRWTGRKVLETLGCMVVEAETCLEAVNALRRETFNLIIMDYRLPDGVSLEMVERMRSEGVKAMLLYLTAESDRISRDDTAKLGITKVLAKPINADQLKTAAIEALSSLTASTGRDSGMREGGFDVLMCPANVDEKTMRELCTHGSLASWIALGMEETINLHEGAIECLREINLLKTPHGGRICVVGMPAKIREMLVSRKIDREIDMVAGLAELKNLGRRTTSPSERMALMDVPVRGVNG